MARGNRKLPVLTQAMIDAAHEKMLDAAVEPTREEVAATVREWKRQMREFGEVRPGEPYPVSDAALAREARAHLREEKQRQLDLGEVRPEDSDAWWIDPYDLLDGE